MVVSASPSRPPLHASGVSARKLLALPFLAPHTRADREWAHTHKNGIHARARAHTHTNVPWVDVECLCTLEGQGTAIDPIASVGLVRNTAPSLVTVNQVVCTLALTRGKIADDPPAT